MKFLSLFLVLALLVFSFVAAESSKCNKKCCEKLECELKELAECLWREIRSLHKDIDQLNKKVSHLEKENECLKTDLADLTEQFNEYKCKTDKEIEELKKEVEELKRQVEQNTRDIAKNTCDIKKLQKQVCALWKEDAEDDAKFRALVQAFKCLCKKVYWITEELCRRKAVVIDHNCKKHHNDCIKHCKHVDECCERKLDRLAASNKIERNHGESEEEQDE